MVDRVSSDVRSRMMAKVRNKDTAPELAVRRLLHAAGLRFRLHRKDLPGKPDIVLPRHRIAVFVHGCFWHGHDCPRGSRPASNVEFWTGKIDKNMARDQAARDALVASQWNPVTIWECDLAGSTAALIDRIRLEQPEHR
jgi:DNA mismatch endonuclease (patch repair protein)